jgi:hypothetical protein
MDPTAAPQDAGSPVDVAAKKKEDERKLEEAKKAKITKLRQLLVLVGCVAGQLWDLKIFRKRF